MENIKDFNNFINETKFISNITQGVYTTPKDVTKDFLKLAHVEGTDKNIKTLNDFLRSNKGNLIKLYHGTGADNDIENEGLKTTKESTKKSFQSQTGFVYLSIYKDSAKLFGDVAYPYQDTKVVEVEIAISNLKADKDQLYNMRANSNKEVGETLADSAIHGNGFRVKGNIPPYMIKNTEIFKK
jgi:hypothetical protein